MAGLLRHCMKQELTLLEPAQLQASNSFLGKELIDLISSPRFSGSRFLLGYVCKLLGLLITQGEASRSTVKFAGTNILGSI